MAVFNQIELDAKGGIGCWNICRTPEGKQKMKLTAYPKTEPTKRAWAWRLMLGPATLLDGVVETLTLGRYGVGAKLSAAKNLARARITKS